MSAAQGYTTWQASHADCPPHADCCVEIPDVMVTPQITQAAALRGMSVEAFIHMAVTDRLRREFGG